MNNIASLQNLVNSVNSIQEKIEIAGHKVVFECKSNNAKESEFHFKFDKLMNKFSVFADEYRYELAQFHKLLSGNIQTLTLKAQQDKLAAQQLAIKKKIESINNSNNEIEENLNAIENTPSIKDDNSYSIHAASPTPIKPKSHPKPKAKSHPKPKAKSHPKTHKNKMKNKKKWTPKNATVNTVGHKPEIEYKYDDNNSDNGSVEPSSSYTAWIYKGEARSSIRIFIGNLANDISCKTLLVYIARRARLNRSDISEVQIRTGTRGKYGLVRFTNQQRDNGQYIDIHMIRKFMNKINGENNELNKSKGKNGKNGKKNTGAISWKKRIFLRFHRNFHYNENNRNNTLYIRNFDIFDKNCYDELTQKLQAFGGELMSEIKISLDRHKDPYCIATFKDIDDAEYCCTSEIEFNGRILEMRYFR